ncbi:MAG: SpoIIE family protein phosphatase [Burkholderiales bacterium]|nr:SpoIIE family protein phosphatase [Bacteroidia bacterium]
MVFYRRIIFVLNCLFLFAPAGTYYSQNRILDSVYADYFNTTDPGLKLSKAPSVINKLSNYLEVEKSRNVIASLQNTKVSPEKEELKKGIILLCNSIIYKAIDSIDLSMSYAKQSLPFLKSSKGFLSETQSIVIMLYNAKGQFDSCILFGNKFLPEIRSSKNLNAELEVLNSMARCYDFKGDRKKAIELSLKAIDVTKQNHLDQRLSEIYISLAAIYKEENLQLAKKYALKSLAEIDHIPLGSTIINSCYLILGNVYYDLKQQDSAIYYYQLCKEASFNSKDQRTYLGAVGNMANIAIDQMDYAKALEYNILTLTEYKKMGILTEIAVAYGSLADLYKDMKEYKKAIKYYDSALIVTKQIQSVEDFIYNYKGLSETYEMMGNDKEAFKYYKLYTLWNDSVNNNQTSKKINALELDYKYKAEQQEKDLIQKNKDLLVHEKIKQQKYIIWAAVFGGLCLIIFLGFTIKANIDRKKTNKQLQFFNNEITEQKNIIQLKNHEITDSITYASRIQQGVIPDEEELKQLLPNHFVFFKPRDIVSGDFYWASKVKSKTNPNLNRTVVAVVDCTGHGVPGAFMSLVGNNLLNQIINRSAISTPAQALDYINAQLPKTIKSKTSTGTIKDGMEIAMCDIDFDTLTMQFSGANSNIYLVRDGEIQMYKGDKQPIGESLTETIINYANQIISLQKNDCVYLISDGYADQFGGDKGKKFKYKPLENLFCAIADKDVKEQREILAIAFDDWKSNHEQVDDVLIMGIKI